MTTATKPHDSVLLEMSFNCYGNPDDNIGIPDGYVLSEIGGGDNGFKTRIYKNESNPNEIIIAYAGTDNPADFISDIQMAIDKLPDQYTQALNTYNRIKSENPNANITITGHSLGGSLAQLVAAKTGAEATTFNSYGTSNFSIFAGINPAKKYDNITNYNVATELLNIVNITKDVHNLGNTYIIPSTNADMIASHRDYNTIRNFLNNYTDSIGLISFENWYNQNKEFCKKLEELGMVVEGNLNRIINTKTSIGLFINSIIFAKDLSYFFYKAFNNNVKCDPLIFDLDGDGKISLTNIENGINFDIDNDGFAQKTAWVSGNDAILVRDINKNGTIDNGYELFGENTELESGELAKSGIEALADLDSNNDGIINSSDSKFSELALLKKDGTLISLEEAGITEIRLNYSVVHSEDEYGNSKVKSATFVIEKENGEQNELEYGEFLLTQNHSQTVPTNWVDVPDDILTLPNIMYNGKVHSLHQAMAQDESGILKQLVIDFTNETDISARKLIAENILYNWAGVENYNNNDRGFDGKKLACIEQFVGRYLGDDPQTPVLDLAQPFIQKTWDALFDATYAQLMQQSHLKNLLDTLEYDFDSNGKTIIKYDNMLTYIQDMINQDTSENKIISKNMLKDLSLTICTLDIPKMMDFENFMQSISSLGTDFLQSFIEGAENTLYYGTENEDQINTYSSMQKIIFGNSGDDYIRTRDDRSVLIYGGKGNDEIYGSEENDSIYGGEGNDFILGYDGNDLIYGGTGNNTLSGGYGNDTLYGGKDNDLLDGDWGDDILYASSGQDTLSGESGSDTYIIDLTKDITGNTIIDNNYNKTGDRDTIIFKGVSSTDIEKIWGESNSMNLGNSYNRIFITFKDRPNYKVELLQPNLENHKMGEFIFEDKSYTYEQLVEEYLTTQYVEGSEETYVTLWAQNIIGDDKNNYIMGRNQINDLIYGNGGNDTILLGSGDDTVYGGSGNDSLDGGDGNDVLYGEEGNDTIDGGYGNDTIYASQGTDYLDGGYGDDTYIIDKDTELVGKTTIENTGNSNENDTIVFNGFLSTDIEDISVKARNSSSSSEQILTITFKDKSDYQLILENLYINNTKIKNFVFDDKNITFEQFIDEFLKTQYVNSWDRTYVSAWAQEVQCNDSDNKVIGRSDVGDLIYGNGGNDKIEGYGGNDTIYGGTGSDSIYGDDGDDILYGGTGHDKIEGGNGNDVLYGNEGYDTLSGGAGDDTYCFDINSGIDTIENRSGNDTIAFDTTIDKNDIAFFINSKNELIIDYGKDTNTNKITVNDQTSNPIENIIIGNYSLNNTQIDQIIQNINAYAVQEGISINSVSDIKNNEDLMNIVNNSWIQNAS